MNLFDIYFKLNSDLVEVFKVDDKTTIEQQILRCSLFKCIEYNQTVTKQDNSLSHMFSLPFLRSICEDIIYLTYLFKVIEDEDRQNFILAYQISDWIKSTESQESFFDNNRHNQAVLTKAILDSYILKDISIDEILINLKKKYSWERRFPTVKQLASNCNLLSLYDYLYAATSRLVHFNPQTLLQMVWGEFKNGKFVKGDISTSNFEKYYIEFSRFYGYYLLKTFHLHLSRQLPFDLSNNISNLDEYFRNKRWPEIITFEEMNIPLESGIDLHSLEKKGFEGYMNSLMNRL